MTSLFLRLETLGDAHDAAPVNLGACLFDDKGVSATFFVRINLQSCVSKQLRPDPAALKKWMTNDAADNHLVGKDLADALALFVDWLRPEYDGSNATDADYPAHVWTDTGERELRHLADLFKRCDLPLPIPTWRARCYRTLRMFPPIPGPALEFKGERPTPAQAAGHIIALTVKPPPIPSGAFADEHFALQLFKVDPVFPRNGPDWMDHLSCPVTGGPDDEMMLAHWKRTAPALGSPWRILRRHVQEKIVVHQQPPSP